MNNMFITFRPLLFSVFISPISRLISQFNLLHYTYADDTTLIIGFKNGLSSIKIRQECTADISKWIMLNGMLLNLSKSEALSVGTQSQIKATTLLTPHLKIASSTLSLWEY